MAPVCLFTHEPSQSPRKSLSVSAQVKLSAMASLTLIRWSAKKIATESSALELSPVPCSSSLLFSFQHIKRRRFATSAALRNSSSNHNPKKQIDSGVGSSKQVKLVENSKNDVGLISSSGGRAQKRQALSLKSLFGKRSLWRRILFASTKVRSIILLNVITIVYGKSCVMMDKCKESCLKEVEEEIEKVFAILYKDVLLSAFEVAMNT
ncbi:hypothetical protein Q3G72_030674 [Acer saccharum]|nr:hypothetical protein Q3G72_030674 [Acer saccharum]